MIKQRGAAILEQALLKTIKRRALEALSMRQKVTSPAMNENTASDDLSEPAQSPSVISQPGSSMVARAQLPPKRQPRLLPPIQRTSTVETDLKSPEEKKEYVSNKQRPSKRGFLLIGDIVCLQAKDFWTEPEKGTAKYSGIVSGDGIINADLECVPKHSFTSSSHEIRWQFRQSLFRIEPARQYGFRALYDQYNEFETKDPAVLEELRLQAEEEHEGNEAELELSYGRSVTYGERIQLRHIHSDSFVTTSLDVAYEHGCLKVVLNEYGNEGSWFEVMPSNKLRQEGEPVRYSDNFTLISTAEKSRYYLHMAVSQVFSKDVSCELNASDSMSYWQAIKYTSHNDAKEDDVLLATGDSFRIVHKQSEGYLSVQPTVIKIPDIEIEDEVDIEVDMQEYLIAPKSETVNKELAYSIYIDYTPSSLNLWEIERECPFIGGIAKHDEFFRIKHVSTGKFLKINELGELELSTDSDPNLTLFKVEAEDDSSDELKFSNLVRFQAKSSEKYISAEKEGFNFTSYFSENPLKPKLKVSMTDNYKEKISTAFVFLDELEEDTLHIHQISRVLPSLIEYYKFLQIWGTFLKKEGRMLSTATARDTELELEERTENIHVILSNLMNKILKDSGTKESLLNRQNTIRDSGLLDFLLQLAQLIYKRVKVRNGKDSEKKECPQTIAMKYLDKLASKIYKTIYASIKDNVSSCNYLYRYDVFLSSQLNNYKKEVGLILKVTFKHSVDIFKALKNVDFRSWITQFTDISATDDLDNMAEQTLILKILSYLCFYNGEGVSKYQNLLRDYLLLPRLIDYIQFDKYQNQDCIIIKPFIYSNAEFLNRNPYLQKIIKYKVPSRVDSGLLILLKDLENTEQTRKYLDYFASLIDLLANLCLSRNIENIEIVISRLNLKYENIYDVVSNSQIHCKLRENFIKLMRVLYIDVDPYRKISESMNRCYIWNSSLQAIEPYSLPERIKEIYNMQMMSASPEQILKLKSWVESVWRGIASPFAERREETAEQKIKFITELMTITGDLLDLKLADYKFMVSIYSPLVKILLNHSNNELTLVKTSSNWISKVKDEFNLKFKDKKELRDKMILATLKVFRIATYIRTNKQIEAFLSKMPEFQETPAKQQIDTLENQLFVDLDYNYNRQVNEKEKSTALIFRTAMLSPLNVTEDHNLEDGTVLISKRSEYPIKTHKIVPDSGFTELITGIEELNLDVFLLNLLFSSAAKEIEQSALQLIINNFNQRSNVKKELQEVELIYKLNMVSTYNHLKEIRSYLEIKFRNLSTFDDLLTSIESDKDEKALKEIHARLEFAVLDLRSYIQQLRRLLISYDNSETLSQLQAMCRNLSIHEIFLKFLAADFNWILCDENGVRSIENKTISDLYNDIYMALMNFCYNNHKNQMILYHKTGVIMSLYGNVSYSNNLMCTILDCHKTSRISEKIIEYVFTVLDSSDDVSSRPQDLRMLRYLIFDSEHGSIFPNTQTNIIKAIFSSNMLKNWMNADEGLDVEKFYDKNVEFNYQLLMLLVACSIENRFAVLQCRRLIPYTVAVKELHNPNLPLRVKKALLHYIFYIFYLDLEDGLPAELEILKLEEILENIILKDLQEYKRYLLSLVNISRKGLYMPVICKKAEENKLIIEQSAIENAKKMFAEKFKDVINLGNTKQLRGSSADDLTKEESDAFKYWTYLTNAKDWKTNIETGLIFFLKDLSSKLKSKEEHLTQEFVNLLERIRSFMHEIHDEILVLKQGNKDLDFDILISSIRDIMIEIPYYVGESHPEAGESDKQCFEIVLSKLEKYIESSYLEFDEFVTQKLCASNTYVISRNVLLRNLKDILGLEVTTTQLDRMMTYLDPENIREIRVNELIRQLRDHFKSNPVLVRRRRNNEPRALQTEIANPNSMLNSMINAVDLQLFTISSKHDLNKLVSIVKTNIVDKALESDNYSVLFNFTKNLESAFKNKESKIYLIEIFIRIIKSAKEMHKESEEDENAYKKMVKHIESIQNVFNNSGIGDLAVSLIHKDNDAQLTYKATNLLNLMLEFNNMQVKSRILTYLKESDQSFQLFSYIKNMLRESRDRINEENNAMKASKNKFLFTKFSNRMQFSSVLKGQVDKAKLTMNLLKFLQRCCDNCYLDFQNYIREQGDSDKRVSVDLVSEMGNFLINLQDISNIRSPTASPDDEAVMLASICLKTLIEACTGPCIENQKILGNRRRVYKFINWLLKAKPLEFNIENIDCPYLSILNDAILFLISLLEGDKGQSDIGKTVSDTMLEVLDFKECMKHSTHIYSKLIKNRENFIYQDETVPTSIFLKPFEISGARLTTREHEIIETGFHISILFLTLEEKYPAEFKFKFKETVELGLDVISYQSKGYDKTSLNKLVNISSRRDSSSIGGSLIYHLKSIWRLFMNMFSHKVDDIGLTPEQVDLQEAYRFYSSNIASVELNYKGELTRILFHIPAMCKFMTQQTRKDIIYKANRNTHQEKIEDFFKKTKLYEIELRHQQNLGRYPLIDNLVSRWGFYANVSFLVVVIINITLLFSIEHDSGRTGSWSIIEKPEFNTHSFLLFLSIVQIILAGLIYFSYLIDNFPVIVYLSRQRSNKSKMDQYLDPKFERIKGMLLMHEIISRTKEENQSENTNLIHKVICIFTNFECVYNLIYLVISIISWVWYMWYAVLLLDIIRRSDDLVNVLKSITLNYKQLILTMILGVIVIYLFSIVAFLNFSDYYVEEDEYAQANTYCDTLINCFASSLITGIRAGGGIGDMLAQATKDDDDYWVRMLFDLAYYIVVIIILMNIIFGIIIDTFAELRDRRKEEMKDIKESCFICGNDKFQFEVKRLGWNQHVQMEHNVYSYLAFVLYIKRKPIQECNGAEKFVKERISLNDVIFFPRTSISLETCEQKEEEEAAQESKNIRSALESVKEQIEVLGVE